MLKSIKNFLSKKIRPYSVFNGRDYKNYFHQVTTMCADLTNKFEYYQTLIEKLQSIASETLVASTANEPNIVSNTSKPISSTKPASKSSYNSSSLNFCKSAIEKFKYSEFSIICCDRSVRSTVSESADIDASNSSCVADARTV